MGGDDTYRWAVVEMFSCKSAFRLRIKVYTSAHDPNLSILLHIIA